MSAQGLGGLRSGSGLRDDRVCSLGFKGSPAKGLGFRVYGLGPSLIIRSSTLYPLFWVQGSRNLKQGAPQQTLKIHFFSRGSGFRFSVQANQKTCMLRRIAELRESSVVLCSLALGTLVRNHLRWPRGDVRSTVSAAKVDRLPPQSNPKP